ncbi:MAG TPA: multicopper oxidase domain-containing protein [Candidatus Methylomirabilis sp.]|nr:multicopper oxidase domain-containing protein [Candidatus Methylomirabilis sp.]
MIHARAQLKLTRRELLRLGLFSGAATLIGSTGFSPTRALAQACIGRDAIEVLPTSPLILSPFTDPLPIPPVYRPSDPRTWRDPRTGLLAPPGQGVGQQDSDGGTHQAWPSVLGLPDPICYKIPLQVREHAFTTSLVLPINSSGVEVIPPDGIRGPRSLPASTIYGFNGTFPGPMINVEYGRPVLVRFENHLDENPLNLDRQDFGSPDLAFLTHLHNGHTAPESDGNPNHKPFGYQPQQWVDNLYLNYPPDGDAREMQSFFWFHDHRMDHTGANVYKGMVGLYPLYDPALDSGDETKGYRLPGIRRTNRDGSFSVDYDIPLAFYDCALDDGVTPHQDFHNGCGEAHPEWWGKTFFRHFPNHGFVGDVFTVNGTAYPVLQVKRRKYRFRFLDASISRIYEFKLMQGTVAAAPGTQGQYQLPNGQQCMRFTQIASEGGLLPAPIVRDSFQLWPAKRREVVIDFTKYQDGTPTKKGDVIYLVNTLQMTTGRKPDEPGDPGFDPNYRVPVLKFVVDTSAKDQSVIPPTLRPLPSVPSQAVLDSLPHRTFRFERSGGFGGEIQWLINGLPFDPLNDLAAPKQNSGEVWTFENGGGGWVHPVHIHEEEHHVLQRVGSTRVHPDDTSKEDVVALDPGESVTFYRQFRTFLGKYVCHCHNLAHEDHAMMFGWKIVP